MKYIHLIIICLSAFCLNEIGAQEEKYIFVKKIDVAPSIDGRLDEALWSDLTPATGFVQYFPTDTLPAQGQTEIYMVFNDQSLYVGIKCYGAGNNWRVNTLKRDYRAGGNDNITLVFDSFQDETNAYFFGINPEGVIREGVITKGGNSFRDFDESWDNKWKGESQLYDGYYTSEIEIPFAALRFTEGSKQWKFGAYRFDTQDNEWSTWTGIPNNNPLVCLAYNGTMEWEEPITSKGKNISFIPYIASGISKDYENDVNSDWTRDIGGDAKIAITSGLNLDLTINPDFSQVEVDRQITDLSRFEIFFPERRQFFLENADLFSQFGFATSNPFFSRRIGVAVDGDDNLVQNRIYAGARLSGKLSDDTRIGVLNMQTANDLESQIAGANYSVLALQQQVFKRSNISFIAVNKQLSEEKSESFGLTNYNRVFGVDFNYSNSPNTWFGKTYLHSSFTPDQESTPLSHGAELSYSVRSHGFTWRHEYVAEDFNAEVGFIRRKNYFRINPSFQLSYYPRNDFIIDYDIEIQADMFWQPELGKTDHQYTIGIGGQLANTSRFRFGINHEYVYLFGDFDPTGTDSQKLLEGTEYNYLNFTGFFRSDGRKNFIYSFRTYLGSYFNGSRYGLGGNFTYQYIPKGSISIDYNYNLFDMPYLEEQQSTFLIGPRIDYTFSKKLFWTTFIQYNTQSQNTNINSRFQWRFAPVSDLFIVYTDNYFTGNDPSDRFAFDIKNRALVLKLTYWLNS